MKLDRPIGFSDKIQPICIPQTDSFYYDGDNVDCFVSGYGTIFAGGPASDALNSVKIPILNNGQCNNWFYESTGGEADNWVYGNMVCAGYEQGQLDGCQGDSGGPLQCVRKVESAAEFKNETWFLTGAVSWGIGCAQAKKPGVYARVSYFSDWIWNQIENYEQNN